jgi:hypothetical protein
MILNYHLKIKELMADRGKAGSSLQKAAQARLENLRLVKNHSYFINIQSAWMTGTSVGATALDG